MAAIGIERSGTVLNFVFRCGLSPKFPPFRSRFYVFGNWSTAYRRFDDWRRADVFKRIFDAVSGEADMEYAMVDATIVKVHRHGQGARRGLIARP